VSVTALGGVTLQRDVTAPMRDGIRVGPASDLFPSGPRIRLEVASSNFPAYDVNRNTGRHPAAKGTILDGRPASRAVLHDGLRPSRLLLPVVPR